MIAWLLDTLVMTGAIMALILLVRRPVGRWFGPSAAYALWALPMIRLLLPPLVLPDGVAVAPVAGSLMPQAEPALAALPGAMVVEATAPAIAAQASAMTMPWDTIAVSVWLGGAALFLLHRLIAYRVMRRELLRDARTIARSGKVRIVESADVDAPVAFGVYDRVVALPRGFLATADSDVSDFAITHELEHHAGNDLLANMAIQPLFALHWFNPVAWLAWRALRSDQEAACDARVMAGRSRRERERYGRLIASFAAGSRFALAAPMAGPLKGDKPIIHRLRALVRNDEPERHRILGRSLFAASVIAVPLTASVTYAADERAEPAAAPLTAPTAAEPTAGVAHAAAAPTSRRETSGHGPLKDAPAGLHPDTSRADSAGHGPEEECTDTEHAGHQADGSQDESKSLGAEDEAAEALAEVGRARAEAARAAAEAQLWRRDAERAAAQARRTAAQAAMRAPSVEQVVSGNGRVQMLRLVTRSHDGSRTETRTMVLDAGCPADRQSHARAVANGTFAEARICTGAPDTARYRIGALQQARASISSAAMPADVRREVAAELDREIAAAEAR